MTDTDRLQEQLDLVGEHIEKARHSAEEHGLLPDTTPESTFIEPAGDEPEPESESESELDDPSIAPG